MEVPLKGSRLHHQFSCSFQHWIVSNGVYGLVTTKTTSPLTPPWGFQHYKINWTECLLVLPFIGQKGKKKDFFFVVLCYMYGSKFLNQKKREQQFVAKIINNDDDDNAMCRFLYFKIRLMFFPVKMKFFYLLKFPQLQKKKEFHSRYHVYENWKGFFSSSPST